MNRSERLKAARKDLGLSAENFAKLIGLSHCTIERLEKDNTRWASLKQNTVDKIDSFYERYNTGTLVIEKPEPKRKENDENMFDAVTFIAKPINIKPETNVQSECNEITESDTKTLTLIEFTYEGLSEAKTHNEFMANVNMLKRILNKYEF